jgi:hypothetical protein
MKQKPKDNVDKEKSPPELNELISSMINNEALVSASREVSAVNLNLMIVMFFLQFESFFQYLDSCCKALTRTILSLSSASFD